MRNFGFTLLIAGFIWVICYPMDVLIAKRHVTARSEERLAQHPGATFLREDVSQEVRQVLTDASKEYRDIVGPILLLAAALLLAFSKRNPDAPEPPSEEPSAEEKTAEQGGAS